MEKSIKVVSISFVGLQVVSFVGGEFLVSFKFASFSDHDGQAGSVSFHLRDGFNVSADVVRVDHPTKHGMLAIKMWAGHVADEELGAIGIRSRVGHGEKPGMGVLYPDVLVSELHSVDTLRTLSVSSDDLATLHHEPRNDSLNNTSTVVTVAAELASAESSEVLHCFWHKLLKQLDHDPALGVPFVTRLTNRELNETLDVVEVELWQRFERTGIGFLILVHSTREQVLVLTLLRFAKLLNLLGDEFPVLAKYFVVR